MSATPHRPQPAQPRPARTARDEDDALFGAYWSGLVERGGFDRFRDTDRVGGLTFADFRDAQRDAFFAGRCTAKVL